MLGSLGFGPEGLSLIFLNLFYKMLCVFGAVLGLRCCTQAFCSRGAQASVCCGSLAGERGALGRMGSAVVARGLVAPQLTAPSWTRE